MARIGTAPPANRYDGIATGEAFAYQFETQEGVPVDGTDASLRDMSPFVIRLVLPDALLAAASSTATEQVDLLHAAAIGASTTVQGASVSAMLDRVTVTGSVGSAANRLESFVANGQFFTDASAAFASTQADAFTAADIALQVRRIADAEPLILLVNPADMSVQRTKMQSFQTRTRYGFVFDAWGDDQVSVSFSGSTGGFIAGAVDVASPYGAQETGNTSSVSGYQEAARRDSAAWQNFMALYQFYRNNGYIYDTINRSAAHLFVGAVAIDFDQWTYVGHIESFSYKFDAASPHKVTFDMEFKASRIYDRDASSTTVSPMNPGSFGTDQVSLSSGQSIAPSIDSNTEYAQPPLDGVLRRF